MIPAALFALALQQEPMYVGPGGAFVVLTADRVLVQPGALTVEANGSPLHLQLRDQGFDLRAKRGGAEATSNGNGAYVLTSARAEGAVTLQRNLAPDQPSWTLTTEGLAYAGTSETGAIESPGAFQIVSKSNAKPDPTTLQLRGTSASLTLRLANRADPLQTGRVAGPVWMKFERGSEELEGNGDRLDLDFTGAARTITLSGHVAFTGHASGYAGTFHGAKAVLTFAEDGTVASVELTGAPTETQIKPIKKGGGGQ